MESGNELRRRTASTLKLMTRNGHHIIQKRDLLEMLRGVPECEHVAVSVHGPPVRLAEYPDEPETLSEAKDACERCGATPEAKEYIRLLEGYVDRLQQQWPDEDDLPSGFRAIDSIHRSHSVTHLVCGI